MKSRFEKFRTDALRLLNRLPQYESLFLVKTNTYIINQIVKQV